MNLSINFKRGILIALAELGWLKYTFDNIFAYSNADFSFVLGCSAMKLKYSKSNVYNNSLSE